MTAHVATSARAVAAYVLRRRGPMSLDAVNAFLFVASMHSYRDHGVPLFDECFLAGERGPYLASLTADWLRGTLRTIAAIRRGKRARTAQRHHRGGNAGAARVVRRARVRNARRVSHEDRGAVMIAWCVVAVLSVACAVLALVVRRLLRDLRGERYACATLRDAAMGVLTAGDVRDLNRAIEWLRRDVLWMEDRWAYTASRVRKRAPFAVGGDAVLTTGAQAVAP